MSDLQTLFDRDPLLLSTQDLDTIIAKLREQRANFKLGEKQAGSMKTPKTPKKPVTKETQLDLASLGLLLPKV